MIYIYEFSPAKMFSCSKFRSCPIYFYYLIDCEGVDDVSNRKAGLLVLVFAFLLFVFIQNRAEIREVANMKTLPLVGKIIYIDPGHGGADGGASNGDILEKEIALNVSLKLRDFLQAQGAFVLMTRDGDYDLADDGVKGLSRRKTMDLHKRLELVNDSDADLLISIHLNSISSPRWRGAQTFYTNQLQENKRLAELIQEELIANLKNTDREAKTIDTVFLMSHSKKPSALVEIGFLSNQEEKALLVEDKYQNEIAASLLYGIMRYFTETKQAEEI